MHRFCGFPHVIFQQMSLQEGVFLIFLKQKWVLHRKQMFNLWIFLLQAHFSKSDLVIHLVLGQKDIIKPIFLIENGEAGEGEIDSASQETGRNITWVHSGVYFRERTNTLINRYLRTEWMLPSLGGGERDQEVYSLTSATRKGRERKHRPSQDLREDDTFPPFSQVKWDTEWSQKRWLLYCYHSGVSGLLCGFCDAFGSKQNTEDCTLPLFLSCFLSSIVVR